MERRDVEHSTTATAMAARRPLGLVAKIMTQQPHAEAARGNQKYDEEDDSAEDDDVPERGDDSEAEEERRTRARRADADSDGDFVERFSAASSSSSSSLSPSSPAGGGLSSVATPPSSPESVKQSRGEAAPEAADESDASSDEPAVDEPRDSVGSETDASLGEDGPSQADFSERPHADPDQQQQFDTEQQLQSDMHVLAAHLQQQTLALEHERSVNQSLQSQLVTTQQTLERAIESVLIENDALRHQNAVLQAARDASDQRAQTASETHDELLRALQTQQQREDHARTIIAALVKERDALKKQLDESKTYCRRLEEDVVTLRAEQQHLRAETKTLATAVAAATSRRNDHELQRIHEQEQLIASLRADLLQMEFEFKTLSVDKDKLHSRFTTLQRQSESQSLSYDVISLTKGSDGDKKDKHKKSKRLSLSGVTGKDKDKPVDGVGFTNLMTLPNCVDDGHARTASMPSGAMTAVRPRTPVGSLVSKTLSSAKKKLFQSSTHTATVVLPQ